MWSSSGAYFRSVFFERYAKMWTQRKRRRVVPLWYEKDQTKNTKKGGGDTKKDQKIQFYNDVFTFHIIHQRYTNIY